jgi:hypothetical protein
MHQSGLRVYLPRMQAAAVGQPRPHVRASFTFTTTDAKYTRNNGGARGLRRELRCVSARDDGHGGDRDPFIYRRRAHPGAARHAAPYDHARAAVRLHFMRPERQHQTLPRRPDLGLRHCHRVHARWQASGIVYIIYMYMYIMCFNESFVAAAIANRHYRAADAVCILVLDVARPR